jgi:hypothetical protein
LTCRPWSYYRERVAAAAAGRLAVAKEEVSVARLAFFGIVLAAALTWTSVALAGEPGAEIHGGTAGGLGGAVGGTGTGSGALPFTGLDLALVVLAGVALVGLGLALRRTTRASAGAS